VKPIQQAHRRWHPFLAYTGRIREGGRFCKGPLSFRVSCLEFLHLSALSHGPLGGAGLVRDR
jgi:hypothetical protein